MSKKPTRFEIIVDRDERFLVETFADGTEIYLFCARTAAGSASTIPTSRGRVHTVPAAEPVRHPSLQRRHHGRAAAPAMTLLEILKAARPSCSAT